MNYKELLIETWDADFEIEKAEGTYLIHISQALPGDLPLTGTAICRSVQSGKPLGKERLTTRHVGIYLHFSSICGVIRSVTAIKMKARRKMKAVAEPTILATFLFSIVSASAASCL
jgi:hypothetical protein